MASARLFGLWYAQLEDIYNQRYIGLKHSEPLGDWILGANLGYYDSQADGGKLAGNVDNQAFYSLLSAKRGGHTFYIGYQAMYGDSAFPRVFANVSPLGNEVPTYEFAERDERSWQARYDYDFAAMGWPGLVATVRYITSDNVSTGMGAKVPRRSEIWTSATRCRAVHSRMWASACATWRHARITAAISMRTV